jgi:hypothetical protein
MNTKALILSLCVLAIGFTAWPGTSRAAPSQSQPTLDGYSASSLYDLGNHDARAGKPALAVLDYERARLLAPMDPDIRANLAHVREAAGLPATSGGWLARVGRFANPNLMYWVGLFGLVLAGGSFLLRRLNPQRRSAFAASSIVGLLLASVSVCDAVATASTLQESVVLEAAPASASPISGADPLFTVPQAEVVTVHDTHRGFSLVRDPEGRDGWVASSDLAPIIPPDGAASPATRL